MRLSAVDVGVIHGIEPHRPTETTKPGSSVFAPKELVEARMLENTRSAVLSWMFYRDTPTTEKASVFFFVIILPSVWGSWPPHRRMPEARFAHMPYQRSAQPGHNPRMHTEICNLLWGPPNWRPQLPKTPQACTIPGSENTQISPSLVLLGGRRISGSTDEVSATEAAQ
ncbi:hypothetical protein HPB50_021766 [Hyalomma asiaticum]|uniref:Uncharacterized protein n=1 Tax=Hyalomma asiaticum TaxID=266040 RepID=A0ACB7S1U7_HYAAI|nr:hypothetical protein HPB50_021766 [Hyalomma asiaticum]